MNQDKMFGAEYKRRLVELIDEVSTNMASGDVYNLTKTAIRKMDTSTPSLKKQKYEHKQKLQYLYEKAFQPKLRKLKEFI